MTLQDLLTRADALRDAGEPRPAVAAYREALRLGADPAAVHFQVGALLAALGEHEQARAALGEVLARRPRDADALCLLGTVFNDLRQPREAARMLEEALAARPAFSEAHFNLGLARFELGELRAAADCFERCRGQLRGAPWDARMREQVQGPAQAPAPEGADGGVNPLKLRHDAEQFDYLVERGALPARWREVAAAYRTLAAEMQGVGPESVAAYDEERHPLVSRTYKRPIFLGEASTPSPLVNPALDGPAIEARYFASSPQVLVLDGLLTAPALAAVRRFCLESTFWNNVKPGYLGAYFFDGFCSELLLRLAWELRERFPGIFRGLPLQMMWGYKYDTDLPGISVHADAAAVNVNFWITPDEANLDAERGGLLVYGEDAPPEWGFTKFNQHPEVIRRYLEGVGARPQRIPHRANRAALFDSDLFHATDTLRFREGYLHRRINVTLLYGLRTMRTG